MQLSLNNWPALSSHLIAFLVGGALSNQFATPKESSIMSVDRQSILIPIKPLTEKNLKRNDNIEVALKNNNREVCTIKNLRGKVIQTNPTIAKFHIEKIKDLRDSLFGPSWTKLRLVTQRSKYRPCQLTTRITYGTAL